MKLKEIIEFLDEKIPPELALSNDKVGFSKDYDLSEDIDIIKIYMDLTPMDDCFDKNTLIITHHPPLFVPETPTYTIHSNWDIIKGGANEALADKLNLKVLTSFDETNNIGRICENNCDFKQFLGIVLKEFDYANIVNRPDDSKIIKNVGIISGFGLKNPDYIKLAKNKDLDILISGDLTQESAILAINLDLTLIDLGHHNSEMPGLYYLKEIIDDLNIKCEIINKNPIENRF